MTNAAIRNILKRPLTKKLSPLLEQLATHLVKTKLKTTQEKNTIRFKTLGQPLVFQKRTMFRKGSSFASSPTKRKRSTETRQFIKGVGGSKKEDMKAQLASNFKRTPKEIRAELLDKSKIKVVLEAKIGLAMKEFIGMTWAQERKFRRMWAELGVSLPSEKKEREIYKKLEKGKVMIDDVAVQTQTVAGHVSKHVPMGRIPDLQAFVFDLLDKYQSNGDLRWHDVGIPDNEIWVKIGGDHGQGSLKICLEIGNLEKPNAREHTHLVSMIKAKDTHEVLQNVTLSLNHDIEILKKSVWNGHQMRVFLFGDYLFLCSIYGISGANGTYPCLWCETTNLEIKKSKEDKISDRTLFTGA